MTDTEAAKIERRRYPRVKAEVYYRSPRIATRKRPIYDISLGGVRIHCDERLDPGRQLELEFFLPNDKAIVAIARVVWSEALPEGSDAAYASGLEFQHLTPEGERELKAVLEEYMD
jgi:c-di-GMP-binding flagellar brake protein YcgR